MLPTMRMYLINGLIAIYETHMHGKLDEQDPVTNQMGAPSSSPVELLGAIDESPLTYINHTEMPDDIKCEFCKK